MQLTLGETTHISDADIEKINDADREALIKAQDGKIRGAYGNSTLVKLIENQSQKEEFEKAIRQYKIAAINIAISNYAEAAGYKKDAERRTISSLVGDGTSAEVLLRIVDKEVKATLRSFLEEHGIETVELQESHVPKEKMGELNVNLKGQPRDHVSLYNRVRSNDLRQRYRGAFKAIEIPPDLKCERGLNPLVTGTEKIAVFGAGGQIGSNLKPLLDELYPGKVIYCDTKKKAQAMGFTPLNVTNERAVGKFIKQNNVKVVISLAALLSGAAEKNPELAEKINLTASNNLMKNAKKWGLRKVQIMSSIACAEHDPKPYDSEQTIEAKRLLQSDSSSNVTPEAHYTYGKHKIAIEGYAKALKGVGVNIPRLAGVLNCHVNPWPSDGTTEELDKMVVACAYQAVYGKDAPHVKDGKPIFDDEGIYHPAVPGNVEFNMVDGSTLPPTLLMLLHKDLRERNPVNCIAEYTVGMEDALSLLNKLNPDFKVEFPKERQIPPDPYLDEGKTYRAKIWPNQSNVQSTESVIGSFRKHTAESSIEKQYNKVVAILQARKAGIDLTVPAEQAIAR